MNNSRPRAARLNQAAHSPDPPAREGAGDLLPAGAAGDMGDGAPTDPPRREIDVDLLDAELDVLLKRVWPASTPVGPPGSSTLWRRTSSTS